jgi:hypothetical protein
VNRVEVPALVASVRVVFFGGPYNFGKLMFTPPKNRRTSITHKDNPFRNCPRDAMHTWQWGNKQFHNTQTARDRCFAESSDVSKIMTALQANSLNGPPLPS